MSNAIQILVGLRGQANHKVQLHAAPAALEGIGDLLHQVLLGYALIDNVPQTLRARFGGEGQAGFLHLLGLFQGVLEHAVNAQGR